VINFYTYLGSIPSTEVPHSQAITRRQQAISVTKLSVFDLLAPYPAHAEIEVIFDGGDYVVDIFKGIANVLIGTVLIVFLFPSSLFCQSLSSREKDDSICCKLPF
jgi:hypothetical protein